MSMSNVNQQSLTLASLPIEILYLVVFAIDSARDLRALSGTNRLFRMLSGPHTATAHLWFMRHSRDVQPQDLLRIANEWRFPLDTEFAKSLITANAPPEAPGHSLEPPGPRRALRRQERVLYIVERFGLFLHNMLAVNYYHRHDWEALTSVADEVEQYLEDLGWVQYYRGQIENGIDSMMVSTVQTDQDFESVAFEDFARKLKAEIATVSSIPAAVVSAKDANNRRNSGGTGASGNRGSATNNELFALLASERLYLRWTSLIEDQLNFFSLEQYVLDKFKPPSKYQLAEYLTVVFLNSLDDAPVNQAVSSAATSITSLPIARLSNS